MLLTFALLIAGFVVLIKGADFLVGGASSIAKSYGVSNLAIGLTVVACGTSAPELLVSLLSAISGRNDASFGNVIGSNNFNLLMILGLSGVIAPLVVQRNTVRYEVPLSLFAAVILFFLVNDSLLFGAGATNALSRLDSLILLVLFGIFLYYIFQTMRDGADLGETEAITLYSKPKASLFILLGLGMLIGGGKLVVDNAIVIAQAFGLSEKLIGLTILAVGTSLPELATSLVAAYRKNTDIAIGNVVGSNIFNILLILGITGVVQPVGYNVALNFDLQVFMGGTVMLIIFMFTLNTRKLDRWEALILVLSYLTYTVYLVTSD
ncbi:MAG: calcium/sodium antiporter [Cyclobacteriaceae bacterium]|nr:calcium/sodium antiporter [Cyclobacteriaceae bacterium]